VSECKKIIKRENVRVFLGSSTFFKAQFRVLPAKKTWNLTLTWWTSKDLSSMV